MSMESGATNGDWALPSGVSITSSVPEPPPTPKPPKSPPSSSARPKVNSNVPPFRIYVYHGNARRPDPAFLADFDAVITTYATLASEYSKQMRSMPNSEEQPSEYDGNSGDAEDSEGVIRLTGGANRKGCTRSSHSNMWHEAKEVVVRAQTVGKRLQVHSKWSIGSELYSTKPSG